MYARRARQMTRVFGTRPIKKWNVSRVKEPGADRGMQHGDRAMLQQQSATRSREKRSRNRITLTASVFSLLLNVLILFLLTLLPQRFPLSLELGLQVELIAVSDKETAKPRVAPRRRRQRVNEPKQFSSPQIMSPSAIVPLTTHTRQIVHAPNESMFTLPDQTELADKRDLPTGLVASNNVSIQNSPMTAGRSTATGRGSSVHAPRRSDGGFDKIRGEAREGPQAKVRGSGQGITGYYNIATVQYEDSADAMRGQALSELVKGMNRWTNVRTQLLDDSRQLDDPTIQHIPLVYIVAKSAFAFSEKERANLRAYLQNGGTLLFSDISDEWGTQGAVANSVRFELWKILNDSVEFRPIKREDPVCASFFQFKKGVPRVDKKRGEFYTLELNGRIAVFYDAAGLGLKWMDGDRDEKWLKWGVNLIVYTLTSTQPSE